MNVFYEGYNKKEWSGILHKKIEPFFRLVSLMLGNFLRQRLLQSMQDFVALFSGYEFESIYKTIAGAKPITFATRLVLDQQTKRFDPPLADVQTTVEALFESLITCVEHIPNVETQLFATPGSQKDREKLPKEASVMHVNFESIYSDQVQVARKSLSENLKRQLIAPEKRVLEFDVHSHIISNAITTDVDAFLKEDNPQMRQIEVRIMHLERLTIRKFKNTASKCRTLVARMLEAGRSR
jgi:hypothetical protein